jgi:hypothetical protein
MVVATTMAQKRAKLSGENGAVAGVASVVAASITSPSEHPRISHFIEPSQGKDNALLQHTEFSKMFQANAHSVY